EAPGAAVVIVSPDGLIHLKGYGVREVGGPPVTPDTLFPLASCSKAFTTTAAALLADEAKLSWDDQGRKHVPDFPRASRPRPPPSWPTRPSCPGTTRSASICPISTCPTRPRTPWSACATWPP